MLNAKDPGGLVFRSEERRPVTTRHSGVSTCNPGAPVIAAPNYIITNE